MSVDIKFNKEITLRKLKDDFDFEINYYADTDLWVISKYYEGYGEQYLQLEFSDDIVGDYDNDCDKLINCFVSRYHGSIMLREISKYYNCRFITDAEEDEVFYDIDTTNGWDDSDWERWFIVASDGAMRGYGLYVDVDGIVCDIVNDEDSVNDNIKDNERGILDKLRDLFSSGNLVI